MCQENITKLSQNQHHQIELDLRDVGFQTALIKLSSHDCKSDSSIRRKGEKHMNLLSENVVAQCLCGAMLVTSFV